jgi:hypothetical protein
VIAPAVSPAIATAAAISLCIVEVNQDGRYIEGGAQQAQLGQHRAAGQFPFLMAIGAGFRRQGLVLLFTHDRFSVQLKGQLPKWQLHRYCNPYAITRTSGKSPNINGLLSRWFGSQLMGEASVSDPEKNPNLRL